MPRAHKPVVTMSGVWTDARFRRPYGFTVRTGAQVCTPRFHRPEQAETVRRRMIGELRRRGFQVRAAS